MSGRADPAFRSIELIRRRCGAVEQLSASEAHLAPDPAVAQRTAGSTYYISKLIQISSNFKDVSLIFDRYLPKILEISVISDAYLHISRRYISNLTFFSGRFR